jgi:type II secretory pathway component PulF
MRFDVLAVDARQQVVALNLEAANAALAAEEVRKQGLAVISLESRGLRLPLAEVIMQRSKRFPTMLFSLELKALLEAGLNLVEAL